jgi:hypothetical protein
MDNQTDCKKQEDIILLAKQAKHHCELLIAQSENTEHETQRMSFRTCASK